MSAAKTHFFLSDQYLTDNLIQEIDICHGASLQWIEVDSAWFWQERDQQKDIGQLKDSPEELMRLRSRAARETTKITSRNQSCEDTEGAATERQASEIAQLTLLALHIGYCYRCSWQSYPWKPDVATTRSRSAPRSLFCKTSSQFKVRQKRNSHRTNPIADFFQCLIAQNWVIWPFLGQPLIRIE